MKKEEGNSKVKNPGLLTGSINSAKNRQNDLGSKAIIAIRREQWEPYVTRNMSFWHQHLSSQGIFRHLKDFGVPYKARQLALIIDGTETHLFQIAGSLPHEGELVLASVLGEAKMKALEKKYKCEAKLLLSGLKNCLCDVTAKNWRNFCAQYKKFCATLQITAIVGRIGADKLTKRLLQLGYKENAIPNLIGTITYPDEHTPLFLSQKELYEIAEKGQKENLSDTALHEHVKNWLTSYAHIPVNFCGEPWTRETVVAQLSTLKNGNATDNLKRLKQEHDEKIKFGLVLSPRQAVPSRTRRDIRRGNGANFVVEESAPPTHLIFADSTPQQADGVFSAVTIKKARETLDLIDDAEVSALAVTVSKATILNEFRKSIFSRVSLKYRPIFEAVAMRSGGASWRDCFYLTFEETGQIISGKKIAILQKKEERKVAAFFTDEKGKVVFLNPEEAKTLYDFANQFRGGAISKLTQTDSGVTEIRGFSASAGSVRGPVKIVISSKDFSKVDRGDILVAIMTSVDFIPVMERAAAFVTNEGGITSHASIVAREMGKPCIIGTKIATKVLRDGMIVEVDANNGTVTVINKD